MKYTNKTIRYCAAGLATVVLLAGCDVTNPGPVQDEFLAQPASQQGLINGAIRDISDAMGDNTYETAALAREIFPGGQTGAWGLGNDTQSGIVTPGDGPNFTTLHEARFIAETAIKRFDEEGAPQSLRYQARLWAGFAYRILGEWWCEAVVPSTDPDDPEPGMYETDTDTYFERAVANFEAALSLASTDEERYAALGGRAAAYVWLEQWGPAAADAEMVPSDFEFLAETTDQEEALYNDFYEATSGQFRSFTQKFTFFEDWYTDTGDPRTKWVIDPDHATTTASLSGFDGAPPYLPQRKYPNRESGYRLVSGWEMRLIEAEAILAQGGSVSEAVGLINQVRERNISDNDGLPLPSVSASTAEEAWTALKRERYLELWLEGRRMGDERRWAENGTPGALDTPDWNDPSHPGYTPLFVDPSERSYCFDIPTNERDRNPNVPATTG